MFVGVLISIGQLIESLMGVIFIHLSALFFVL
jgi:hypothetical protein